MKKLFLLVVLMVGLFPATAQAHTHPYQRYLPPEVWKWEPLVAKYFPPEEVGKALACMASESGGRPYAVNVNRDGTIDQSLFQLNSKYHPGTPTFNPFAVEQNVQRAAAVWKKEGWGRWYGKACGKPVYFATKVWPPGGDTRNPSSLAGALPLELHREAKMRITEERPLSPVSSWWLIGLAGAALLLRSFATGRILLALPLSLLRALPGALWLFFERGLTIWLAEVREIRQEARIWRREKREAKRRFSVGRIG